MCHSPWLASASEAAELIASLDDDLVGMQAEEVVAGTDEGGLSGLAVGQIDGLHGVDAERFDDVL